MKNNDANLTSRLAHSEKFPIGAALPPLTDTLHKTLGATVVCVGVGETVRQDALWKEQASSRMLIARVRLVPTRILNHLSHLCL